MRVRSLCLLLLPLAVGCGGGPRTVTVSGRVLLDQKPLAKASVSFQPIASEDNKNPGPGSYAETDDQGYYSLKLVGENRDGAVVGQHRVQITRYDRVVDPEDDHATPARNLVPPQFNRNSKLTWTVTPDGTKEANFTLTSK
jgi:hypothetical protein